jgi:hypothetical protein
MRMTYTQTPSIRTHVIVLTRVLLFSILLVSAPIISKASVTSCPPGSGAFTACFYSGTAFNKLLLQRTDSQINFDWSWGSPFAGGPVDQFSARWEGDFAFNTGNYRFNLTCDDGARLYIDDKLVLDRWTGNQPVTYDISVPLTAGTHRIRLEYYEGWGVASAKLSWLADPGWREFYVSPSGNDNNDGRTPTSPWRTTWKVALTTFLAGDHILFEGSQSFDGTLYFSSDDQGTSVKPIVVSSYGTGRATIRPGTSVGLLAYDTAGIEVRNLNFIGASGNSKDGVQFFQDLAGNVKLPYIRIDNVETSGFGSAGVSIFSSAGTSGYEDVRITNVSAHDNLRAGIQIGATNLSPNLLGYSHRNVYIGNCRSYNNLGVSDLNDTGFGIFIDATDAATIERNIVYNNGQNTSNFVAGPMGIMAMEANNVLIQNNEIHHIHSSLMGFDGGAIDFDGGVTNSVIQYNYTHDNDGPGITLAQYNPVRYAFSNNTVRYNISQNDGRKSVSWSGMLLAGNIRDSHIYNNTIFGTANSNRLYKALMIVSPTVNFDIRNNLFVTADGMEQVAISDGQINIALQGNAYWGSGLPLNLSWAYSNSKTLADFRKASGQEMLNGMPSGLDIDPKLTAQGTGLTLNDTSLLSTLSAYKPLSGSPLIDTGLTLSTFGISPGTMDFVGTALPQLRAFDIGAMESTTP